MSCACRPRSSSASPTDERYPREIARLGLPSASADVEVIDWDLRGDPPVAEIDLVVLPDTIREELSRLSQLRARLVQWQSIGGRRGSSSAAWFGWGVGRAWLT